MRYGKIPGFEQRRATRKTSFSSRERRTAQQHTETTCYHDECTTQETSFPGRIGKENEGRQEKPLDNRRYSQFMFESEKLKKEGNYKN